jgi:hypothetical protein
MPARADQCVDFVRTELIAGRKLHLNESAKFNRSGSGLCLYHGVLGSYLTKGNPLQSHGAAIASQPLEKISALTEEHLWRPAAQPEITSGNTHPPLFPSLPSPYEFACHVTSTQAIYSDLKKVVMRHHTTTSNYRLSSLSAAIPTALLTHREFSTVWSSQHRSQASEKTAA